MSGRSDIGIAFASLGAGCGLILFLLACVVGLSAFFGWIFMSVWNAAVVPTFDAPVLSFWVAWGIWFLICLVTARFRTSSKED